MRKIFSVSIISSMAISLFIACESEMELKGLDHITPHLVVNAILRAEADTNRLYITHSRSVFHNDYMYEVYGYTGWYKSSYSHLKDADISLIVNNSEYTLPYHKPDSSYIFCEQLLKQGDKVNIKVKQGEDMAEATVVIPEIPEVISVDTLTITENYERDYLRFFVKIKDKPGQKNFYRLRVERRTFYYDISEYSYGSFSGMIHTEDPVLINGFQNNTHDMDIELVNSLRNEFWIFTDNLFEGQEYTLVFYTEKASAGFYSEETNLRVYLQAISEDLYNYYYSVLKFRESDESLNEPVIVYKNIENGFGLIGTVNEVLLLEHEDFYERDDDWHPIYSY